MKSLVATICISRNFDIDDLRSEASFTYRKIAACRIFFLRRLLQIRSVKGKALSVYVPIALRSVCRAVLRRKFPAGGYFSVGKTGLRIKVGSIRTEPAVKEKIDELLDSGQLFKPELHLSHRQVGSGHYTRLPMRSCVSLHMTQKY